MGASSARIEKIRVWGLTGGIASGKSTVASLFQKEGIPVVDADAIARELSSPGGAAHDPIIKRFGTADRAKLRDLVFADPQARRDLEAILHPMIAAESQRRFRMLADAHTGQPEEFFLIYEAALLVETGRYRDFEGLIVVSAPREQRVKRLVDRDRIAPELADKILASQASDADRRRMATVVIENDGSREELAKKVRHVARRIRMIEA